MITGIPFADWALLSVSLFNAMLMLWLGLTVMLTAERRSWGVWVIEEGLLLGALFFVVHTVILGYEYTPLWRSQELNFWWRLGWMPVILAPFAWYVVILWYCGFNRESRLIRWHLPGVVALGLIGAGLMVLVAFFRPMPTYTELLTYDFSNTRLVAGVPILFLLYPPYALLCILLPIDALRRPEPSHRMMGDLARQRSRKWLFWTTAVLLAVVLAVTLFLLVVGWQASSGFYPSRTVTTRGLWGIALFDLILSALVAVAVIFLGQAVVTYEVFTGKTLPRRGFLRYWRNALLLSAAVSVFVGGALVWQPRPVYSLLFMAGISIVFYALLTWRSFVQRDDLISGLRPFVNAQNSPHLLKDDSRSHANELFESVCRDVLGAKRACLVPMGVLSPLVDAPMRYPPDLAAYPNTVSAGLFSTGDGHAVAVESFPGFQWAIPLWTERGLTGALLLSDKQDDGLYTQEEIEIARAGAERIVELVASEQMSRRLMQIQRNRLAENRVMDLRTRRTLHDDTLPTLHLAILRLSGVNDPTVREVISDLSSVHGQISDLIHTTPDLRAQTVKDYDLVTGLRGLVESEFSAEFTAIHWETDPLPPVDGLVHEIVMGAAREILRNAAIHGRGDDLHRPLNVTIRVCAGTTTTITIHDDGVGLHHKPRTRKGGAGGGLGLHSTMMAIIGGYLTLDDDNGTRATLAFSGSMMRKTLPSPN